MIYHSITVLILPVIQYYSLIFHLYHTIKHYIHTPFPRISPQKTSQKKGTCQAIIRSLSASSVLSKLRNARARRYSALLFSESTWGNQGTARPCLKQVGLGRDYPKMGIEIQYRSNKSFISYYQLLFFLECVKSSQDWEREHVLRTQKTDHATLNLPPPCFPNLQHTAGTASCRIIASSSRFGSASVISKPTG